MTHDQIVTTAAKLLETSAEVVLKMPVYAVADRLRDADLNAEADQVLKYGSRHPDLSYWSNSALQELVGKKLQGVMVDDNHIYLKTEATWFAAEVEGDCCSQSWMYRVTGAAECRGEKVLCVLDYDPDDVDPDDGLGRQESESVYGIALMTTGGTLRIVFRNSSNGYYGGNMNVARPIGNPPADAVEVAGDWVFKPEAINA